MFMNKSIEIGCKVVKCVSKANKPIKATEIAEKCKIEQIAYMQKILKDLVKANILNSKRGPKGGFIMDDNEDGVSFLDIYEAMNGRFKIDLIKGYFRELYSLEEEISNAMARCIIVM